MKNLDYLYSIPDGVITPKPGSIIDVMYDEIRWRGGEATQEQLVAVGARWIGPRTGEPHGKANAKRTVRWLLRKGRLSRRLSN